MIARWVLFSALPILGSQGSSSGSNRNRKKHITYYYRSFAGVKMLMVLLTAVAMVAMVIWCCCCWRRTQFMERRKKMLEIYWVHNTHLRQYFHNFRSCFFFSPLFAIVLGGVCEILLCTQSLEERSTYSVHWRCCCCCIIFFILLFMRCLHSSILHLNTQIWYRMENRSRRKKSTTMTNVYYSPILITFIEFN